MQLNEYQLDAAGFARYESPLYPFTAIAEEAGEVTGKVSKILRGDVGSAAVNLMQTNPEKLDDVVKNAIIKELGDVLWQLAACATELGFSLGEVAAINLSKLHGRKRDNTIRGEGDAR